MKRSKVLGLDIGTNSIGWAIVEQRAGRPSGIVDAGVRIFQAGMEIDELGRAASKNVVRREARGRRRNLARQVMRQRTLRGILERNGFLLGREAGVRQL